LTLYHLTGATNPSELRYIVAVLSSEREILCTYSYEMFLLGIMVHKNRMFKMRLIIDHWYFRCTYFD